jgi:PPOX class probable F420-dependent enzyme
MLTLAQRRFIDSNRVARLATVGTANAPHLVPVCFCLTGLSVYISIDEKPKTPGARLQRLRNIERNPAVAVTADRWDEDWSRLAWVMLRGNADILEAGAEHDEAQAALRMRYPQYRTMNLAPLPVIAVRIQRVACWGILDGPAPED